MFGSDSRQFLARTAIAALAAASSIVLASDIAQAASFEAEVAPTNTCGTEANPTYLAAATPLEPAAQSAKSIAILGGQASALDQIRLAQEGAVTSDPLTDLAMAAPELPLVPGVGGVRLETKRCEQAFVQPAVAVSGLAAVSSGDEYLGSKRLKIGRTQFDGDWERVSSERISAGRFNGLVGPVAGDGLENLRQVNSWVNHRIAYVEDNELFARADYWAGAKRTLKLGRGDCEDIALTKMQLLAAAGVPREDMILTIARDLVRNADHAVLIVRYEGRHYLLDNASDEVFDAAASYDYRPVLSFGDSQTWLHGY